MPAAIRNIYKSFGFMEQHSYSGKIWHGIQIGGFCKITDLNSANLLHNEVSDDVLDPITLKFAKCSNFSIH